MLYYLAHCPILPHLAVKAVLTISATSTESLKHTVNGYSCFTLGTAVITCLAPLVLSTQLHTVCSAVVERYVGRDETSVLEPAFGRNPYHADCFALLWYSAADEKVCIYIVQSKQFKQ